MGEHQSNTKGKISRFYFSFLNFVNTLQ